MIVNDADCEECNVQEQILVPRTLLGPRVRVGLKLEELLGPQPPADEVGGHNQDIYLIQIPSVFIPHSNGVSYFQKNLVPVKVTTAS